MNINVLNWLKICINFTIVGILYKILDLLRTQATLTSDLFTVNYVDASYPYLYFWKT